MDLLQLNWGLLAPELTILIFTVIVTIADLFLGKNANRKIFGWVSIVGIVIAIYFTINQLTLGSVEYLLFNTYRVDTLGSLFKLIFLVGTGIAILLAMDHIKKKDIPDEGEYYYLFLTAALGGMLMASSADLITLYIGLELLSFSSYILTGIRKKNFKSNEASFKYLITGAISSAIFLFGASYIYGITGSTNLFEMAQKLQIVLGNGFDFFIYFGFFLMLIGLLYKISAVPSHMWTPDVYEGAPTPVTAFISVVSKAAGFAIIIRIFLTIFGVMFITDINQIGGIRTDLITFFDDLTLLFAIIAMLTMIVGNTLALKQTNVKRLMALSSVAQAGYILIPLGAMKNVTTIDLDISNIIFYLIAYLFVNMGAFAIIIIMNRDAETEDITSFRGLYHRNPLLGIAMTVFLLSLAGLPVTIGFIAKFKIFISAIVANSYALAIVMLLMSVVSYFYYFNIIRQMYMRPGKSEEKVKVSFKLQFIILVLFLATILFGLFPNTLFDFISENFKFAEIFFVGNGM